MEKYRPIATTVANIAQKHYEENRVPETLSTPEVSAPFFDVLRKDGFFAAGQYLFQRFEEFGGPKPATRLFALTTGIAMVSVLNNLSHEIRKPNIQEGKTEFSPRAGELFKSFYGIATSLLFFSNESGSGTGGGGSINWNDDIPETPYSDDDRQTAYDSVIPLNKRNQVSRSAREQRYSEG